MPPFPERESSLLAKLKKKKGGADKDDKEPVEPPAPAASTAPAAQQPTPAARVNDYFFIHTLLTLLLDCLYVVEIQVSAS